MHIRRITSFLMLGALAVACTDRMPTSDQRPSTPPVQASNNRLAEARKAPLTNLPIASGAFSGTLSITHVAYDQASGQLLFSGTVTRAADGVTDVFTNVPGTLSQTQGALGPARSPIFGTNFAMVSALTSMMRGTTSASAVACPILFLSLQPIHLDLLGLVLNLDAVVLDLHAEPGPGNLLGNLLCAVTGLLDGPGALSQILQIIDRINTILAAV